MDGMFPFVGRGSEKEAIKKAIGAQGQLRILFLVGEPGIGKTWLLDQVPAILQECANKSSCHCGEIIDFYYTPYHRSSGIEEAIRQIADPDDEGFVMYKAKREEYEKHRIAGRWTKELEQERAELENYFLADFNAITRTGVRPVLRFDTLESLQYESDRVQELCGLDPTREIGRIETRAWLLNNIPRMENTVVILAGRPRPERLWTDLARASRDVVQEKLELKDLSSDDAVEYFRILADRDKAIREAALTDETAREFWHLTEGRPLRLSEVALLLKERVHLADDLRNLLMGVQAKPGKTVGDALDQMLLKEIQGIQKDVDITLPYIAWARKGVNAELLHLLMSRLVSASDWPLGRCRGVLRYLRTAFPLTKPRLRTHLLLLHDQMYETMEGVVPFAGPERDKACQIIVNDYYQPQIEKAKDRRKRELQVEQLYYRFVENPREGYAAYARLSDEAIIGHEVGLDMGLREEMLRFCHTDYPARAKMYGLSPEFLDRDAAVRWVKRYIARGEYARAIEVADRIEKSPLYDPTDTFFTAALAIYRGEAMAYLGQDIPEALDLLQQATHQLEAASPKDKYEEWSKELVLGRGHNNVGFAYYFAKQYDAATKANLEALPHLRRTELLPQQAGTLTNLAYVYALQGKFDEATVLCWDALNLWRRSGYHFGEGLTLNVLGRISIEQGIYDAARKYCGDALRLFKQLGDERGEGLACIALGQALRKEGIRDIYSLRKAEGFFKQGVERLERAISIFTGPVQERPQAVEAYNELGCTYRDWAIALRRARVAPELTQTQENMALRYLNQSIELALPVRHPEAADSWNDKAEVYYHQGDLNKAKRCLEKADALIPLEYRIRKQHGVPEIPAAVSAFWEVLGKNSLVRGHILFARGEEEESDRVKRGEWFKKAIEQYVLASAYFGEYSSEAQELSESFKEVYDRLRVRSVDRLTELQGYAAKVENRYGLKPTRVQDVFTRALGIKAGL